MIKIYYFFDRENNKCYFFTDKECAEFYKELVCENNDIIFFKIKSNDFEGTDIFTLNSFKEKLKEELSWYEDEEYLCIKEFMIYLDSKIRDDKLKIILND
jgi:hypothetical protein